MVIIIFGPPGSGKGTQAELLSNKFNLYSFEASKVLEEKFKEAGEEDFIRADGKTFYIRDEKKLWQTGFLCSPPFVAELVLEEVRRIYSMGRGIIFSGSPRTLYEGEKIVPQVRALYGADKIKIIYLDITPEETVHRNTNRRICKLARHPILYNEETKDLKLCPIDGSELIRREGLDDEESVKIRIKEFEERTLPLFDYFEKEGFVVNKVNGSLSPADVFKSILKAIGDD